MNGYIMELTKLVKHQAIIQCTTNVIVVNEKEKLLLGKRTDNYKRVYSGNSLEIDENVQDCTKRELFEEMEIIVDN